MEDEQHTNGSRLSRVSVSVDEYYSLPQQNSRRSNVSCNRVPLPGTVSHLFYIPHTDASTLWHGGPYRRTVTVIIIKNHSVLVRGVHLTLPHPMTPRGTRRRRRLGDAVRKPTARRPPHYGTLTEQRPTGRGADEIRSITIIEEQPEKAPSPRLVRPVGSSIDINCRSKAKDGTGRHLGGPENADIEAGGQLD